LRESPAFICAKFFLILQYHPQMKRRTFRRRDSGWVAKDLAMIGRMIPIGGTPRTGRSHTISQSVGVARSGIVMSMTCDVVVLQNQHDPATHALSRVSAAATTFCTLTSATQGAAASRDGA
jgi:hypothetical protein